MKPATTPSASKTTTLLVCLAVGVGLLLSVPLGALAQETSVTRAMPAGVDCEGGTTFTVTLSLNPDSGDGSGFVDETPPPGTSIGSISSGGSYNADQHRVKWVFFSSIPAEVTYDVTVPAGTPIDTVLDFTNVDPDDQNTWHYRFNPSMQERDLITGATTVDCAPPCPGGPDGTFHPFDGEENGIFNDDNLFTLIDAWRVSEGGELDDLLFAGIDSWKLSPGSYC